MKKLMMLLAVAGLIFASCGGPKTEQATIEVIEETCTLTPEQEAMFANWERWDDLTVEERETLVSEMKAFLDECKKAKCADKKECGKEMCPEKKAKIEEFKTKWEAFEELELDVQKELIDMKLHHIAKKMQKDGCCKGQMEGCCKEEGKSCKKEGGEGCKKDKESC